MTVRLASATTIALLAVSGGTALGASSAAKQDEDARADARNALTFVESCWSDTHDYTKCRTAKQLGHPPRLSFGTHRGQVEVTHDTKTGYTVTGHSRTGTDFRFVKSGDDVKRTCSPSNDTTCRKGRW